MLCCALLILMTAATTTGAPTTVPSTRPLTVVAFGDSTTASRHGVTVFAERLRDVKVINAGVPGNNTRDARRRFESDVLAPHPDIVTIWFGINDSAVDVWKNETEPRVSLKEYSQNLSWMITQLQSHGIRPIVLTPNPCAWTDELRRLWAKPPYRPDDPDGWNVLLKDYAAAAREVATARRVPLVDVYQLFQTYAASEGHNLNDLLLDGMHPNDAGQAIIAEHVAKTIETLHAPPAPTTQSLKP
jgi:lysophospholipase L1-like esterase